MIYLQKKWGMPSSVIKTGDTIVSFPFDYPVVE